MRRAARQRKNGSGADGVPQYCDPRHPSDGADRTSAPGWPGQPGALVRTAARGFALLLRLGAVAASRRLAAG